MQKASEPFTNASFGAEIFEGFLYYQIDRFYVKVLSLLKFKINKNSYQDISEPILCSSWSLNTFNIHKHLNRADFRC